MSIRQSRLAHVTGLLTLVASLAAVTATVSTRDNNAPAVGGAQFEAHVFVPTRVALPAKDEEPAPTF